MISEMTLSPSRAARIAGAALLLLLIGHLGGLLATYVLGIEYAFGLVPLFDFDQEGNLPTLFSSYLLLSCSAVLAGIAAGKRRSGDRFRRHWVGLAAIFLFLAVDELLVIHEKFSQLEAVVEASGVLHFPWVIVYGPVALLVGLLYLRFLGSLPREVAVRFVIAGGLYVGGALGMELVGAPLWEAGPGPVYALVATVEELCEFVGVIVFLHALLTYAERSRAFAGVVISIGSPAPLPEGGARPGPSV